MLNLKAALEKVAKKDATHVILETFYNNGEKTHDLFASEENRDQEYAVITGLDQDEKVEWTIETEKSPAAEITANTERGIYEEEVNRIRISSSKCTEHEYWNGICR